MDTRPGSTGRSTKAAAGTAKRRLNLSVRGDLVRDARRLKLNLSHLAEQAIEAALRQQRVERWREDNREAASAFARYLERHGIFGDTEERGF